MYLFFDMKDPDVFSTGFVRNLENNNHSGQLSYISLYLFFHIICVLSSLLCFLPQIVCDKISVWPCVPVPLLLSSIFSSKHLSVSRLSTHITMTSAGSNPGFLRSICTSQQNRPCTVSARITVTIMS